MKIQPLKLLFMDIDGVLNSLRSFTAFKPYNPEDDLELETMTTTDPVSVKLINMVIEKTGAKLVASTSHRFYFHSSYTKQPPEGYDMDRLAKYFHDLGIRGELIDATPSLTGGHRGREIKDWLENVFPAKFPQYALEKYAILEDGDDVLAEQAAHLVKTTWNNGFSMENYLKTLTILGYSLAKERLNESGPRV